MSTPQLKHVFFSVALFCVLVIIVGVLSTVLSTEQIVSALGPAPPGSYGAGGRGATRPAGTTRAVFLPLVRRASTTTYAAFLLDGPSELQMMGTGGLLGFGVVLGLFLLSEKPGWLSSRSKQQ